MALHGKRHRHGNRREAHAEHHADQQDGGDAQQAGRRLDAEEKCDSENDQHLQRRDRHDKNEAAQNDRRPVDWRRHEPF